MNWLKMKFRFVSWWSSLAAVFFLMQAPWLDFAKAGVGAGGGGDPKAVEFIMIAKRICDWSQGSLINQYPEFRACGGVIASLESSLNGPEKPRLAFTDQSLFDQGVSKVAIFDREAVTITVNRPLWDASILREKYLTVAIEIAGLSSVLRRYDLGETVATSFLSISGSNSICARTPVVVIAIEVAREKLCEEITTAELAAIEFLNLPRRKIEHLDVGDFVGLTALTGVNLRGNQLAQLPDGLFKENPALAHLELQDNNFSLAVQEQITKSYPKTEVDF